MSIRTRALFLTGLLAAVSCSDAGNPLAPEQPGPVPGLPSGAVQPLDCTVTVATGELRCEIPQPDAGDASAAGQLIIGGQNVYVRLASTNFAVNADTIQFDVTVQNLIRQPIGTEDGTTVHEDGVRVFFAQDPVSNNPNGPAAVANADGEAFFLAPDQPYFEWAEMLAQDEVSGSRTWKLQYSPGSTSVSFRVYVAAQVQYPTGWIEIVPPVDTLLPGASTTLSATAYDRVGRTDRVDQVNFVWSTVSESGVVTVDPATGEVTAGASSGTDTVRVTNDSGQEGFAVIVVNTPLVANDVTYPGLGNVSLNVPNGFGLTQFVSDPDGDAVSIVAATDAATAEGGLITVAADGSFLYRPAAGFTGTDTYTYTATDGTAFASGTLTLEVGDRYWFAQADQAGTGTMASPGTLKTAEAGSAAGETIFVLHAGASTAGVNEGIVLKAGQALIGQGVSGSIVRMLSMPTGASDSLAVTLLAAGSAPGITRTTAGATVQLASGNTVRGLGISSTAGAGIAGTTFGTLTTGDAVSISATGGAALLLSDGALAGTFAQVGSSGSTGAGLSLTNVTGTLAPTGGSITNPAGAGVLVSGGSVNLTWTGNVTQPNNAALVDVSGGHDGALEFNTGTVSATNGTGLQFNGVSGTYTFSGTTTLNGGDAGVDITNGSDGTFTFGTGTSITSPSGTAFNVYGSSPTVTFSGGITKGNAGAMVEVGEQPGGSVTFQTGTLQATAGSGISLSNADGTVAFNGTTTLSGGPSVAVVGGSAGTISFTSGASVTNPSSAGILVNASAPTLTYAGTVSAGAARPAQIEGMTGGSVSVSGAVSGSAQGILVQNNNTGSAKTITFSGAVTLSTAANTPVSLANNTGATIGFTGGNTDLTTTSGTAFSATGGGTVNVTGGGNDVSTQTGSALNLNGVSLGALGMSFATLNVTGAATAPVVLTSVGVTTGSTLTVSGGSIVSGTGTRLAVSGGSVNVTWAGSIAQATAAQALLAVTAGHTGTVTFSGGTLSGTNGTGLQFDNADGSYTFSGTTTLNGGDAGIDVLNGSGGTFSFGSGTSISNPTGVAFLVNGGTPTITFAGPITHNSGRAVSLANMTGGSAVFSGNVTGSGPLATGISVTGSSANVTFSGSSKTFSTQGNAAVTLTGNSGSMLFSGGNLAITTTGGAAFTATGGGTVQVTGANNTIASGTGTALDVQNTTIGASGLTFVSIGSSGGTNAIVLNNTGSTNGLLVTGTGSAGSGGTISGASSNQISLTSARNVSFSHMVIQNGGESGIYGSNLTNFRLKSSTVSGNGNAVGEAGLEFENLLGTDSVMNSVITGSAEDNIVVRNNTGTLDSLVIVGNTISSNSSIGSDGILVTAANTANATVRVRNNTLTANKGDHFQATASNSANLNVVLFQNTMTGGHALALGQGITMGTGLTFTGTFTYDLNDNDILNGPISNAITIDHDGTTGSLMQGRVRNNVIGTSGADLSCSAQASGIEIENGNRGTHTYAVTGNTIRRCYDRGIFLDNGDGSNVVVNATVSGNTVNELTTANARQALYVNVGAFDPNFLGARDSFTVCADIQGNTLTSHPSFSTEAIRLRMRFDSRMNLPGYGGSFNNAANEVNAYLAARNTLNASATATTTAAGAPYGYYNIASCPTPP